MVPTLICWVCVSRASTAAVRLTISCRFCASAILELRLTISRATSRVSLINRMQEVGFSYDGIVLNAGAYTHTSIALLDCIRSLKCPVVEVHISNVHKREEYRHHSMISAGCLGVICGFGLESYELAIQGLLSHSKE